MNIIYICHIDVSKINGDTKSVIEIVKQLRKLGNFVVLFARNSKSINNKFKQNEKFFLNINFPILIIQTITQIMIDQFSIIFWIIKSRKKMSTDIIVHRAGVFSFGSFIIAKLLNIPLVFEHHGITRYSIVYRGHFFLKIGSDLIEKNIYPKVTGHIVVTKKIKEFLNKEFNIPDQKIDIVPNGANIEEFEKSLKSHHSQIVKKEKGKKYIIYLGNLVSREGVQFLIESFGKILKKIPSVHLIIIGDGEFKANLQGLVIKLSLDENVTFIGSLPYEKVPAILKQGDLGVIPIIRDINIHTGSCPMKVFDYLLAGLPIVTSNIPGLEFIQENKFGLSVEPENSSALAEKIVEIFTNEQIWSKIRFSGPQYIKKYHDYNLIGKRIENILLKHK